MDQILKSIILAIVLAQGAKIFLIIFKHNQKFSWKDLILTGGMPSSHSAVVTALTLTLYLIGGLTPIFYTSLVFSLVVLRDAIGVRRTAGEEGKILNMIIHKTKLPLPKMHYSLGHTPKEVFAGILIGLISSVISYV